MKNNIHVANEKFEFAKALETILQQIIHVQLKLIGRKNLSKLPLIFHLFNHGHPMIEYTTQNFFVQLNFFNNPMKHWFDGARFERKLKVLLLEAGILSL
jgi:hypothetical protein